MDLHLEAEDGIDQRQTDKVEQVLKVVVPVLPRILNTPTSTRCACTRRLTCSLWGRERRSRLPT